MKRFIIIILCILNSLVINAQSNDLVTRPAAHAPIGVTGDHTHNKSEWMFSYRFMHMNMEDLKLGNENTSFSSALSEYMVTPTRMSMDMHMIGIMHAPTDRLTLAVMSSIVSKEMDHITRMGGIFTTNSSGIGDSRISGLYRIIHQKNSKLHGELGFLIPTGSINKNDIIPASAPNEVILPYPMQIGSGTWGTTVGFTYLAQKNRTNFGVQARSLFRTGTNNNQYRLGNLHELSGWLAVNINSWLSISGRLEAVKSGTITGANPSLNPRMVITADTENTGRETLNGAIGFNLLIPENIIKGLRFSAEYKQPFYQKLNGFQLKTIDTITIGAQYSF